MKKLSAIIAMVVCLTIGGVYATWSYAEDKDIYDAYTEIKVSLEDSVNTGAAGTFTIQSNLVLTVDQANDDHDAKLVFESNNGEEIYLTVTFKPSSSAAAYVKENGVPSELYWGVSTPMQFKVDADGNYNTENSTLVDIFKFTNVSNNVLDVNITWTKQTDGTFTYTLDQTDLEDMISLSQNFRLDTKATYDEFVKALGGNIVARVTDGTVNQPTVDEGEENA